MIIKRTLSDANLAQFKKDFDFLGKLMASVNGELDLAIRDNYVNLYYRGHSLARINFKRNGIYEIKGHQKFWGDVLGAIAKQKRFSTLQPQKMDSYIVVQVEPELLHPLFQKVHLKKIFKKVKEVGHSEELTFEQILIMDNWEREDLLIIDRQVKDSRYSGRMDLLALKQDQGNNYHFVVLEVKMGNNPELVGMVAGQLDSYVKHISKPAHFKDYKTCYETQYQQKKELCVFAKPSHKTINITGEVEGLVVVGGYSVEARKAIKQLKTVNPGIKTKHFSNRL